MSLVWRNNKSDGLSITWDNLIRELQKEDHNNDYFVFYADKLACHFKKTNPRFMFVRSSNFIVSHPVVNILWHLLVFPFLLKKYRIDLAHIPDGRRFPLFKPCHIMLGVLHIFHHFMPKRHRNPIRNLWVPKIVPKFFVPRADSIWTYTENSKRDIAKYTGYPAEKIHVVNCGIGGFGPRPPEAIRQRLAKYNVRFPYILCVNRIEHPLKNHVTLIQAYALLKKRRPDFRHSMVFVGHAEDRNDVVMREIKNLRLQQDIQILGYVGDMEDIYHFYAGADIAACPSQYEGFGLPPLEGMASGVPTLSANNPCIAEVVGNGGLLHETMDPEDLANKMERLLFNKEEAKKWAARGLERAKDFSWEKMAKETKALYEKIGTSLHESHSSTH